MMLSDGGIAAPLGMIVGRQYIGSVRDEQFHPVADAACGYIRDIFFDFIGFDIKCTVL